MRPKKREPARLRRGKAFHREVQKEWREQAQGDVSTERPMVRRSGQKGRMDIFVDCGDGAICIAEIKSSNWDVMRREAVRRNVRRQARQVWTYIESHLNDDREVSPGIVFPKRPQSTERTRMVEDLFEEQGISVVWQDESVEERRARAS